MQPCTTVHSVLWANEESFIRWKGVGISTLAHFPESAEAHPSFLLARWRHETTVRVSSNLQQWYMNLAAPGPHLATVLAGSNLHYEVVQQGQIPPPLSPRESRPQGPLLVRRNQMLLHQPSILRRLLPSSAGLQRRWHKCLVKCIIPLHPSCSCSNVMTCSSFYER